MSIRAKIRTRIKHTIKTLFEPIISQIIQGSLANNSTKNNNFFYLGDSKALVKTHYNDFLVLDLNDNALTPVILRTGWWEPWIDHLIQSKVKPGFVAVDIGSNCGYHTNLIAKTIREEGKLFAFEANPKFIPLLKRSLHLNGYSPRTSLYSAAVFDKQGSTTIAYSNEMLGSSLLPVGDVVINDNDNAFEENGKLNWHSKHAWGECKAVEVITVTLDDTVGEEVEKIDFLHMDVEGCEPGIILGAKKLISRSKKLQIIAEWTPLNRPVEVLEHFDKAIKFLIEEGFKFYKIEPPKGDVYTMQPELIKVDHSQLKLLTHCDLYIVR